MSDACVREAAEATPGGQHEKVTLSKETRTPRARTLIATFKRERTPPGESKPAKRQRKKNEGKARARAICRLDPTEHERYKEAERARKRLAVPTTAWAAPICWQPREAAMSEERSSSCCLNENVQLRRREAAAYTASSTPRRVARCDWKSTLRPQMRERRASRGVDGGRASHKRAWRHAGWSIVTRRNARSAAACSTSCQMGACSLILSERPCLVAREPRI